MRARVNLLFVEQFFTFERLKWEFEMMNYECKHAELFFGIQITYQQDHLSN